MTTVAPTVRGLRPFVILTGITSLGVFLQALTAGLFVEQEGRDGWATAHGVIGNIVVVLALALAVLGLARLRATSPQLAWGAVGLFVAVLGQTGVGQIVSNDAHRGWLLVHIPLAFVIFGLCVWLSLRSALVRRAGN